MKISICIPTYERKEFLKEAIESCLNQTRLPYEILIGDDSKTSITENFIKETYLDKNLPVNIRYFRNRSALGQCNNVNFLMSKVQGDKLMLLHDDDLLLENAVEDLCRCFEKNEGIVAAFGKQYLISDLGDMLMDGSVDLNENYCRTKEYEGVQESSVISGILQQFPNNAYMIESEIAKNLGYSQEYGDACDFEFGFRLGLMQKKLFFLNEHVAKYRLSENSVLRNNSKDETAFQAVKIVLKHSEDNLYDVNNPKIDNWIRSKMPLAISQGILTGKTLIALRWFFSPYYLGKILSFSGVKRMLMFVTPVSIALKINSMGGSFLS